MSARATSVQSRPPAKKAPSRSASRTRVVFPLIRVLAGGTLKRTVLRYPLHAAALALGSILLTAVLWNALMAQTGKHPAPLFGPAHAPRRAAAAPAPLPAPRPDPVTVASIAAASDPARAPDPIGTMIRASDAPRAADIRAEPGSVEALQRALTRLGYGPLKSDGIVGTGTKAAIERFERDHNLPVTGAPGPRVAKAVAEAAAT